MKKWYFAAYKPYGMLCQFTGAKGAYLLSDLHPFPKDVYSIGRLDKTSEGLLLLTNDNKFIDRVLSPQNKLQKTYYVQVDNAITSEACKKLEEGQIIIKHNGKDHQVLPAQCKLITTPKLPERSTPIRYRKDIPTSWIALSIKEGKNRQVRKMTAAVGYPTLRLVRYSIGNYKLGDMQPGDVLEINPNEVVPDWINK